MNRSVGGIGDEHVAVEPSLCPSPALVGFDKHTQVKGENPISLPRYPARCFWSVDKEGSERRSRVGMTCRRRSLKYDGNDAHLVSQSAQSLCRFGIHYARSSAGIVAL